MRIKPVDAAISWNQRRIAKNERVRREAVQEMRELLQDGLKFYAREVGLRTIFAVADEATKRDLGGTLIRAIRSGGSTER